MGQPPPPETPPGVPQAPAPQVMPAAQTGQPGRFSPDGFWWWDGASWRPAYSQDRLWRWNGQSWVPAASAPARSGGGVALAIGVTVGAFAIVLILVVVVVLVILGTMGGQIANVFSNVAAALNSTPSP